MTNPNLDEAEEPKHKAEEKPDDLEITSIGSLYSGAWDKKYWSSSRGKDRYPYPVGYRAIRAHNGSTYKMEIQEGPKGPLFLIIGADGESCSGQTPYIAWDKLQKKCLPRMKIWHGKRFSCKIDGVEFFGFKNPFVQRLLRELAANVNGTVERSLSPSSFGNGTDVDNHPSGACSFKTRPQTTGKRSRTREIGNVKSSNQASIKRTISADMVSVSEVSNSIKGSKRHHNDGNTTIPSAMGGDYNICTNPAVMPPLFHQEESEFSVKECLALDSDGSLNYLSKEDIPEEANGSGKCQSTQAANNLSVDERKPLNRSQDTKMDDHDFPMAPAGEYIDTTISKDYQGLTEADLFAPDTLEFTQDKSATNQDSSALDVVISDGLLTESHPAEETSTSKSNASSQKMDFDSVGQDEMATSMMKFLLPQAIPLLKKGPRNKTDLNLSTNKEGKESKMHTKHIDLGPAVPTNSIVPDSLEDDQYGDQVANQMISSTDKAYAIDIIDDDQRGLLNSSKITEKEISTETVVGEVGNTSFSQAHKLVYTRKKVKTISQKKGNYSSPVSESIKCKSNVPETYPSTETLQMGSSNDSLNKEDIFLAKVSIGTHSNLNAEKPSMTSSSLVNCIGPAALQDQAQLVGEKYASCSLDLSASYVENQADKNVVGQENLQQLNDPETSHNHGKSINDDPKSIPFCSDLKPQNKELNEEDMGVLKFVGCYSHPVPVLSVLLSTRGNDIYVCVLCGLLIGKNMNLFIYKVATEEPRIGHPSLIGHTSITFPVLKEGTALENSDLQFTPDGHYLVLPDSIKTPYCRQGKINCLCSTCASSLSKENAVNIVQVKVGYVSVVARLKAAENQRSILVCEPNNLVSVGESGRLHLWVMNSTWSAQMENIVMPAEDCISPGIEELKRIPNCTHLVVGHNGCGEFSLWDISKRVLVSRFSASSASICQFLPISLFAWQMKFHVFSHSDMEEHVSQMMASTLKNQLSLEGEDVAVCLLVSSSSDSDAQQDFISGHCLPNPVGWWRLALLVKNMVIFGTVLDPRAAVLGASGGQGICGTCDGLVYTWELSSGAKLGTMHHFKGGGVSCIATDDSRSGGAVAVAGDNQLLVYMQSRKSSVS